ncbi:MAG: helix-turn-helix transcriptional regulator [Clostridia bacterium]|nr:helix-turn-helix transcriptional regulator [Clostridia bacterium]
MNENYIKQLYDDNTGFRLHYTIGEFAGKSTTQYLHYDVELSFIYFIKGIGEIKIEGKKYDIQDGDLILLKPSELYHCIVKDGTHHERLVLYFNGDLLKNFGTVGDRFFEPFYNRNDGFENKIPKELIEKDKIDVLLLELLELVKKPTDTDKLVSQCKMVEILSKIRKIIGDSTVAKTKSVDNKIINNVIAYINQNFHTDISLEAIAKEFFVDKFYISRLFKEHVGVTIWNYVIFRRLTAFNDLIRVNTPIEQAYLRVGFQNYSNFFRLYKKHMNMTPSEYKKKVSNK